MTSRFSTHISCPFCAWRARHTGDTPGEVLGFLAATLNQHIREDHADTLATITRAESLMLREAMTFGGEHGHT